MFAFSESRSKWLTLAVASVTVVCAAAVGAGFHGMELLQYMPRDAIHLFCYPALLSLLAGWLLPARRARPLLAGACFALLVWVIGFAQLAATLLLLLDALVLGEATWRACRIQSDEPGLLDAALITTLGLAEIGLVLTLVSHFHVANASVYSTTMVLIALLGHKTIVAGSRTFWRWLLSDAKQPLHLWLGAGALFGAVLLNFVTSTFFGSEGDTLGVYMYLPSYIATYGGWSYDFHIYDWALMPNLLGVLGSVPYILSGPTGAQFLNSVCTVLVGVLIYAFCRPRIGVFNAMLCAIGWLTLPVVIQESASLHDDVVLGLFLFAALVCLYDPRVQASRSWAAGTVTGLLVSAAVATKLMGWILCPVYLLAVLAWLGRRRGVVWALQVAATAVAVVVVAGGFQYWYAYAATGNPVFPFYNAIFHSPYTSQDSFFAYGSGEHFGWSLPFLLTFHTELFGLGGPGSIGFQWLMLLPAALLTSLPGAGNQRRWFGFAGLWFAVVVMLPEQFARYLIPALPFLSVFIGEIAAQMGRILQAVYKAVFIGAIALNIYAVQDVFYHNKDIAVGPVFSLEERALNELSAAPIVSINKVIDALEPYPVNVLDLSKDGGAGLHGTAYGVFSGRSTEVSGAYGDALKAGNFAKFIGDRKISYIVFDAAFDRNSQGQGPQAREFCEQHATRVTKIGTLILYKVDPEYIYASQVLINPGLEDQAKGWSVYKADKLERLPGSGYLLQNDEALFQDLRPDLVVSGRDYFLNVVASCLNQQGWVHPRVEWKVGKQRREVGSSALYFCSQKGPLEIRQVITAPPEAVAGTVGVSANAGAQVVVQSISLTY